MDEKIQNITNELLRLTQRVIALENELKAHRHPLEAHDYPHNHPFERDEYSWNKINFLEEAQKEIQEGLKW